jgi:hypothetical protein
VGSNSNLVFLKTSKLLRIFAKAVKTPTAPETVRPLVACFGWVQKKTTRSW